MSKAEALEKKVEIESPYEFVKDKKGDVKVKTVSYLKRRPRWSTRLNFATSEIELENETPAEKDGAPFQIDISMNKNFGIFSIGPEIGFTTAKFENTASFTAFSLGVSIYLNGLTETSYLVPFASAGGMSISSKNGAIPCAIVPPATVAPTECSLVGSEIIPYYRAGLLIGLNWIDKSTALRALSDYGMQNSFIYVAARKIAAPGNQDPAIPVDQRPFSLETTFYLEYGLQLEF